MRPVTRKGKRVDLEEKGEMEVVEERRVELELELLEAEAEGWREVWVRDAPERLREEEEDARLSAAGLGFASGEAREEGKVVLEVVGEEGEEERRTTAGEDVVGEEVATTPTAFAEVVVVAVVWMVPPPPATTMTAWEVVTWACLAVVTVVVGEETLAVVVVMLRERERKKRERKVSFRFSLFLHRRFPPSLLPLPFPSTLPLIPISRLHKLTSPSSPPPQDSPQQPPSSSIPSRSSSFHSLQHPEQQQHP